MFTKTFPSSYSNLWQTVYDVGAGGVVVGGGARQGHLQSKCQQYFLMIFLNFRGGYTRASGEEFDHLNFHVWIVNDTALDDLFFHHLVEENH